MILQVIPTGSWIQFIQICLEKRWWCSNLHYMKQALQSFNLLQAAEIDFLLSKAQHKTLRKGEFLIKEGRTCHEIGFVQSGMFRVFYHNSAGEEVTSCFIFANTFAASYTSFITQTPTLENIEALTDISLLTLPADLIFSLEQSSTNWANFSKTIAQQEFIYMEQRLLLLLMESAEFRYKHLLEHYPSYLQLIPLNYLASYLGITQRHLSRIRKAITI